MAKTYIVKLGKITGTNGVDCTNPSIVFEKPSCPNIVCELEKDAQGNPHSIKIQVPDECPDGCVDVKINCKSDCSSCGEQRFKICPCITDKDCPSCSKCGPEGYCISQCKEGEFCADDICKECDEFHPCTGGKVCESGKCKCPPNKPYQNQQGECVECNQDTPLSPCQECVGGFIIGKKCPAGVLNPNTCECVECVKDLDCVKPNEKCGPNGCECIDGFRRNPVTGDCEPEPDCVRDSDCGDCRKCLQSGKCSDYTCPPGYTPSNIPGKCCVKLCDCNNPSCPPGHVCVNLDGTKCFCQDCNVKCNNGKCPEGCKCKDGENCAPSPCKGKCINGVPCAPGCGCDEDDNCVECASLNCDKCKKVKGCECNTPDNCEASSDCNGPCDETNPCPKGCGCNDGRTCEKCSKIDCIRNSDCPEGCDCGEDKKCKAKPCDNVNCVSHADCGINCNCNKGKCEPGDNPNPDNECIDIFEIKEVDCKLKAELNTDKCCECRLVYLHANQSVNPMSRTVVSTLRVGPNISDQALSATGIVGDASITGQVRYTWEQTAKEVNGAGVVLVGGAEITLTNTATTTFSNTDVSSTSANIKSNGSIITQGGKSYKIIETVMYAESIGIILNSVNTCSYKLGKTILYRKSDNDSGNYSVLLDKVQRCKTPIFSWYKSTNGTAWTLIKKVYSTVEGSKFVDFLDKTGGLELCKYFKVQTDCGCVPEKAYSCNNGGASKYDPHLPKELNIEQLDPCGKDIKISEITLCDLYDPTSLPFKLYINGTFYSNITPDASHKIFTGGLIINNSQPIYEVKLEFPCNDCGDPLIINLPTLSSDCFVCSDVDMTLSLSGTCGTGINASGILTGHTSLLPVSGCRVDVYLNDNLITSSISDGIGSYNATLPVSSNGTYTVKAINCYGCVVQSTITINDCCAISVGNIQYDCITNSVTSVVTGCNLPNNTTFAVVQYLDIVHVDIVGLTYSNNMPLPYALPNGRYRLFVQCDNGCGGAGEFTVACGVPDFNLVANCQGLQGQITASGFTGGSGAPYLLEWSSNAGQSSSMTDPTTWNSTPNTVYTVKLKDSAGNYSVTKTITGIDCSVNSFSFTGLMKCISGIQKFCFTPTVTGYFNALVKDVNNITVFSGQVYGSAGQETCTDFTTVPAAGVGSISLTYNGNTITQNINVTACAVASITYNCTTGLSVTGVGSFHVHSAGYPSGGYGPFTPGEPNLFFTDGVNDSRVLTIKSPDGSETYGTVSVNCCSHAFVVQDDVCQGNNAKIKVSLTGNSGNYSAQIYTGIVPICAPVTIAHAGGTVIYPINCNLVSSTNYTIQIDNLDYNLKLYKDQSIGNVTCSVTHNFVSSNCGSGGSGGGGNCPVSASDILISGGCNPSITNTSSFPVTATFKSTENTNCTGGEFNEGSQVSINPGQTVAYGPLGHPNLGKKLYVNYTGLSGDGCLLIICYNGCTGSSTCTLTDDPVAACSTTGAQPGNRRLTVTNTNTASVLLYIDGVFKQMLTSGGQSISYYPNNTTHTILFKCVDDITQTRTLNYLLNC